MGKDDGERWRRVRGKESEARKRSGFSRIRGEQKHGRRRQTDRINDHPYYRTDEGVHARRGQVFEASASAASPADDAVQDF